MSSYFASIFKCKSGGFFGEFSDFPEGATQGDTLEECIFMLQDALNICAEEYTRERRGLPKPSSLDTISTNATAKHKKNDTGDLDQTVAPFIQLFKAPDVSMKPVKITISLPKSILERIDLNASANGLTRSGVLARAATIYTA